MGTHPSNDAITSHKTKQMSTKTKSEGVKATNPSKEKTKKDKLNKKNLQKATEDAKDAKESKTLKYIYPKDITTSDKKKTFRRNARATKAKYEKQLAELKHSHKDEDKKEYARIFKEQEKWAKGTYLVYDAEKAVK